MTLIAGIHGDMGCLIQIVQRHYRVGCPQSPAVINMFLPATVAAALLPHKERVCQKIGELESTCISVGITGLSALQGILGLAGLTGILGAFLAFQARCYCPGIADPQC